VAVRSLWVEPERPANEVEWAALETHDVFKIYRSGPTETVALRGLDLKVERGEAVAVHGRSGSGKSTFLTLAAGLDEPSAGEVRSFGRSLGRLDERELADYRAQQLAIVFQSDNLWPALTAEENIVTALRLAGRDDDVRERAQASLAGFGLEKRAHQNVGTLSGGERQRVAIAAAFAREAPLVLADEPTGELDERNEQVVIESLLRLRDDGGATVVVVTHSDRVARAVDRMIELRDGRVAA
jgi:putative ABC transport system ATP-binding protein